MLQKKGKKVKLEPVKVIIGCSKSGRDLPNSRGLIGAAAEQKTVVFFQTRPKKESPCLRKKESKRQSAVSAAACMYGRLVNMRPCSLAHTTIPMEGEFCFISDFLSAYIRL